MARTNLSYQINSAIENGFRPGMDKHAGKHTGENLGKVFSFAEKKSLQQISFEFKDYMKANYNDVKLIKNVKPEHWQNFLIEKSKTCSTATLQNYVSRIGKIEVLTQNKFGFKSNWRDNITSPPSQKTPGGGKLRVQQMAKEDYNKIMEASKNSTSQAVPALEIAYRFGLRVEDVTKLRVEFVSLEKMELKINGKGGRTHYLPIRPEDLKVLKQQIEGKNPGDKLISIKKDSINTHLRRTMEKIGIKEKYPNTGVHAIRKLRAQEEYDKVRSEGMSKKDAMDHVSKFLGHGRDRYDTFNTYVQNQH